MGWSGFGAPEAYTECRQAFGCACLRSSPDARLRELGRDELRPANPLFGDRWKLEVGAVSPTPCGAPSHRRQRLHHRREARLLAAQTEKASRMRLFDACHRDALLAH